MRRKRITTRMMISGDNMAMMIMMMVLTIDESDENKDDCQHLPTH